MPSLREALIHNCVVCLDSLRLLHEQFITQPSDAGEIVGRLDELWTQIEAAHSWVSSNFQGDPRVAVLAERFSIYCADNGDQLIEIHRPSTIRIHWLRTAHAAALLHGHRDSQARIGYNLGVIQVARSEFAEAETLLRESSDYFEQHQYFEHYIASLNALGLMAKYTGKNEQAVNLHSTAFETASTHDMEREAAVSAQQLGRALKRVGRMEEAVRYQLNSRITFLHLGDDRNASEILIDLARDAIDQSDVAGATKFCDEVLTVFRAGKISIDGSMMHHNFGAMLLDLDHPETDTFIQESLNAARELRNQSLEGCLLQLQSVREYKQRNFVRALDLCDQSIAAFEAIGVEYGIEAGKQLRANLEEVADIRSLPHCSEKPEDDEPCG